MEKAKVYNVQICIKNKKKKLKAQYNEEARTTHTYLVFLCIYDLIWNDQISCFPFKHKNIIGAPQL